MKALFLNIALAIFGLSLFTACNSSSEKQTTTEQTEVKQEVAGITYTCPMHPEVVSDEPGKCPKCGMNLEEKKAGAAPDSTHEHQEGDQH